MKRISELDNLAHGDIQDADLVEVGRTITKNYKFTWLSLKTALTTFFNALYSAITHATEHELGGTDAINVAGLSGELADNQPPKAHATSHQLAGTDALNVGGLSGELADNQPPKSHGNASHTSTFITDTVVHGNEKHVPIFSEVGATAGEINGLDAKLSIVNADLLIIEDSADTNKPKKVTYELVAGAVGSLTGEIRAYTGATAVAGWLMCDGAAISRVTYAALFGVTATLYGVGDGSTTFNIPNLQGRVMVGLDSTIADFNTRGKTGGSKTHTLTEAELAAHTHTVKYGDGTAGSDPNTISPTGTKAANVTHTSSSTGSGTAHENMPPYVIINYLIKT